MEPSALCFPFRAVVLREGKTGKRIPLPHGFFPSFQSSPGILFPYSREEAREITARRSSSPLSSLSADKNREEEVRKKRKNGRITADVRKGVPHRFPQEKRNHGTRPPDASVSRKCTLPRKIRSLHLPWNSRRDHLPCLSGKAPGRDTGSAGDGSAGRNDRRKAVFSSGASPRKGAPKHARTEPGQDGI